MVEFTGERVVPDQVSLDLWSEHIARYAFAQRYARGKSVLDCGCGTGYGSAELAQSAASVTGIDISTDAVEYARLNYGSANARYVTGSCLELAFPAESFEVLVAFEVIEHLADFRQFLAECARVLTPGGIFIVSTPNKSYYAETRAESGPNPFHTHEFTADEFRSELSCVFNNTCVFLQNHVECFPFVADSLKRPECQIDGGAGPAEEAHFFIAVCSNSALPESRPFVYLPKASNLLREREQHIHLLEDQLRSTQSWLAETQAERDRLLKQYRDQLLVCDKHQEDLAARARWAGNLENDLKTARERITQVQLEFAEEQKSAREMAAAYNSKVRELESENLAKTKWALETEERLVAELKDARQELAEALRLLKIAEDTVISRTVWAQQVELEKQALQSRLDAVRESRWLKLGRKLGLGPNLT